MTLFTLFLAIISIAFVSWTVAWLFDVAWRELRLPGGECVPRDLLGIFTDRNKRVQFARLHYILNKITQAAAVLYVASIYLH